MPLASKPADTPNHCAGRLRLLKGPRPRSRRAQRISSTSGIYREIARPSRLVFTTQAPRDGESVGTLVFSEHQGKTTLTMTIACPSREARDAMLAMRVDVGTLRTLDNLDEYLKTSGRDRPSTA